MKNDLSRIKTYFIVLIIIGSWSCNSSKETVQNSNQGKKSQKISILHTNDIHGSYMPFKTTLDNATAQTGDSIDNFMKFKRAADIGGLAWMSSAIKSIRKEKGADNVIMLDGGDTFSDDQLGNLTKGEAMIRMMNLFNYDLMVLGNHDFDYGLERTRELDQLANFSMRAANIIEESTGSPIFNEPYKILERDGLKIGILPLAYRNTPLTGNSKNIQGLKFINGIEAADKYLPEMKAKADIIILLSHEGMAVDKLMAEKLKGVDVIVGGHSHDVIEPPYKINETYVVQALSDAAVLGETELLIKDKKLTGLNSKYHYLWHDEYSADAEMENLIKELRAPYQTQLEEKITSIDTILGRQYKSESPFDKVITSLMMEHFESDAAFLPGVGYGISLQGDITSEDIFTLLPHPAKIVTLEMTGEQIRKTLEQTATNLKPENKMAIVGGLIQSSGIHYYIDISKPVGQRISKVKINNKDLDESKNYKVTTHTGLLNGIHNYEEFGKGKNIEKTDIVLTEFVLEQLRKMDKLSFPKRMKEVHLQK